MDVRQNSSDAAQGLDNTPSPMKVIRLVALAEIYSQLILSAIIAFRIVTPETEVDQNLSLAIAGMGLLALFSSMLLSDIIGRATKEGSAGKVSNENVAAGKMTRVAVAGMGGIFGFVSYIFGSPAWVSIALCLGSAGIIFSALPDKSECSRLQEPVDRNSK